MSSLKSLPDRVFTPHTEKRPRIALFPGWIYCDKSTTIIHYGACYIDIKVARVVLTGSADIAFLIADTFLC